MFTYWFPAPVSFWWPLAFAIVFALAAVVAVNMTLVRREEERDAGTIASLYGIGFGLIAVTEFMMFLDVAFGWSLATIWALTTSVVSFFAIAAVVIAVIALGAAVTLQMQEERGYRQLHPAH
jgi:hypothetical protein